MKQDTINIAQLAEILGLTECATRNRLYHNPGSLPPWFRDGKRYRWSRVRVYEWLEQRQRKGEAEHARRSSYRKSA